MRAHLFVCMLVYYLESHMWHRLASLTAIDLGHEKIPSCGIPMLSEMTPFQAKAFELLGLEPHPAPSLGSAGKAPAPSAECPQA